MIFPYTVNKIEKTENSANNPLTLPALSKTGGDFSMSGISTRVFSSQRIHSGIAVDGLDKCNCGGGLASSTIETSSERFFALHD